MLYFGTKKRWNKNKSIKEILHIPEGLEEYVNDYKINVIEVAWLSEERLKILSENNEKCEVNTMCEVVDRLVNMGENAERIRIIKKKLEKGMSLQEISELLELPLEQIEELIQEK